jgi:MFS family permease
VKQYRSLFRNRNFLLHWLAGAISNVGDFFNTLALVKLLSEDPAHLGLYMAVIMVAHMLPGLILGPVAGVMADRLPRKVIMIVSDVLRAGLMLGLVVVRQPVQILTLVALAAIVSAFFNPASNALMPSLVAKEELVTAGSLSVMTQRMAMLLGNGIGAWFLMAAGAHNVFYVDAASFVVSALMVAGIRVKAATVPTPDRAEAESGAGLWGKFRGDIGEALAFLRNAPVVRHLLGTLAITSVADSALNVLLIPFFMIGLGLAAASIGFVNALFGGASVIGALVIGAMGHRVHWRHLMSYGMVFGWFVMMAALLTDSVVPSITFLTLLGLGSGAMNVGLQAAIGELVPDHVRGRVFSAWGMVNSSIYVVGVTAAGLLSDKFGPTRTLMGFTTFFLLGAIYAFIAFRRPPAVRTEAEPAAVAD